MTPAIGQVYRGAGGALAEVLEVAADRVIMGPVDARGHVCGTAFAAGQDEFEHGAWTWVSRDTMGAARWYGRGSRRRREVGRAMAAPASCTACGRTVSCEMRPCAGRAADGRMA